MQKIEFLENRFADKNNAVKVGAEIGAPHTAIMDKLCSIENQMNTNNLHTTEALKSQVMDKIQFLEKKINEKSECTTANALKTQVMEKINHLESKINNSQPDDVLLKLANLEKKIDVQTECSAHENDMKQQVFEKLAKLENHFKLKSEIPVVSKSALKEELNKLDKLIQMRQKLV
jgi:ribosome-associated translation inhibitor RaiA